MRLHRNFRRRNAFHASSMYYEFHENWGSIGQNLPKTFPDFKSIYLIVQCHRIGTDDVHSVVVKHLGPDLLPGWEVTSREDRAK